MELSRDTVDQRALKSRDEGDKQFNKEIDWVEKIQKSKGKVDEYFIKEIDWVEITREIQKSRGEVDQYLVKTIRSRLVEIGQR